MHAFKASSEEVIVMYSEKIHDGGWKAKYMKEDVWVFFRKLAGWHLATSLKGKIHERRCMKVFFVNLQAGIPQLHYRLTFSLVHEISCSIRGVLKNLSKFSAKHKEQSSGGVLSKDVLKKFTKKTSLPESPFQQSCRLETLTQQKQPLEIVCKTRCS